MEDLEHLKKQINKIFIAQNHRGLSEFEGYSPIEMNYIIYDTFGNYSPLQLLKLDEVDYKKIPILNQIKYLLRIIENQGELKLTAKGFLPTKVVSDIYKQNFIKDELIESGITKLYKEKDSKSINLTRILSELSGIVKKRKNKLSLTKKGKEALINNHILLRNILTTFGFKFNWGYYDRYEDDDIGQVGFGFSLILISKYGAEKRLDSFYSSKYFTAFPVFIERIESSYLDIQIDEASRCYSLRTFDRFLKYFGLIKIYSENIWYRNKFIVKTELFDKLIKVQPHNKSY